MEAESRPRVESANFSSVLTTVLSGRGMRVADRSVLQQMSSCNFACRVFTYVSKTLILQAFLQDVSGTFWHWDYICRTGQNWACDFIHHRFWLNKAGYALFFQIFSKLDAKKSVTKCSTTLDSKVFSPLSDSKNLCWRAHSISHPEAWTALAFIFLQKEAMQISITLSLVTLVPDENQL